MAAAEPERIIMPTKKQWVYAPAKPKVPDAVKNEVFEAFGPGIVL